MIKKIFIYIFFLFIAFFAKAQEVSDCSKTLKLAHKTYDAGEIEKVEELLLPCLENGFTRSEKTEALKLIIQANLFDDDLESADRNMKELLGVNPDFIPKENDHKEIKVLYAKFRTDPLLIIDFLAGVNLSYGYVLSSFEIDHNTPKKSAYTSEVGINGGAIANYLLKNLWRANLGFFYKSKKYSIGSTYNKNTNVEDTIMQTIDAVVDVTSIEIPFGITKEFGRNKLVPHIGIGANLAAYLNSTHTIKREYSNADFAPVQGTSVNTISQSSLFNISTTANAGVRYKIGLTGKLIFDVRFNFGLINQSSENNRYENSQLIYQYYFIPDDFLLHNLSFNIGYSQLLYKPKKLRN